ncbi:MAG: L-2-amino-thiazoline-4-carboxylic acid hydrolase [Candidatus Heimdallarchaeota archaeon]|nr:MAG: L-2-amino-thiazoline-4-carboxylic acid hydrolase [Candidatus Heimdallarchaeota archaeon]
MSEINLLSSLSNDQQIEILRKNWMSHDARWQYVTFQELGIEKGNKLNQDVSHQMGKVITYRLLNALGISQVNTIKEMQTIFHTIMELCYPAPRFIYHFEQKSDSSLLAVMEYCTIYENVKKAGIADQYECACSAMHLGWCEAMKIDAEEKITRSLKKGDDFCEFIFKVNKFNITED